MDFQDYSYYYYITIALQAFCVFHCLRKGTNLTWIWLIVFLPLVGCLVYLFSEVISKRSIQHVQSGAAVILNSGASIKKLEAQLQFADTFNNRILLADACLASGDVKRAIGLYETSLTGAFAENEHVLSQLVMAYAMLNDHEAVIRTARKIYKLAQFPRSKQHILYAMALDETGNHEAAEKEFKMMTGRFSNFEARYQYGMFLGRNNRGAEARQVLQALTQEGNHLSPIEKKTAKPWIAAAKDVLRQM